MEYKTIILTKHDKVATLKLNYEQKLNSLSQLFFDEFDHAIESVRNDNDCLVLIIRGTEKVFSAGGDLKEIGDADPDKSLMMCMRAQKSFGALHSLNIPVIAAMDGIVFGGGFEMALHCDMRFCTNETVFRLPEADLGLIPGSGGISIFSRLFGSADAAYYLFTGNQIPVDIALNKGFVQNVYSRDEIYSKVETFADSLTEKSPESISAIKRLLVMNLFENLDDCLIAETREFVSVQQNSGKIKIAEFFKNKKKSK